MKNAIDQNMFETAIAHSLHGGFHRLLKTTADNAIYELVWKTDDWGYEYSQVFPYNDEWDGGYEPSERAWITANAMFHALTKGGESNWYHLLSICRRNDEINGLSPVIRGWSKPSTADVERVILTIIDGNAESLFTHF